MLPDGHGRKRLLVFEPDSDGHQLEWLLHLLRFARCDRRDVSFVVSPALATPLRAADIPGEPITDLHILSPLALKLCRSRRLAFSGMARWWFAYRHMQSTNSDAVLFLFFDHLTLPFALGLGIGGHAIGILFRPSIHYANLGHYTPTRGERLRDWRKSLLYRLTLRNRAVRTMLTLDPYFAGYAATCFGRGRKVAFLADPIDSRPCAHPLDGGPPRYAPQDRTVFVLFGYLTARKGTLILLDALSLLSHNDVGNIAVIFAGRLAPEIADEFARKYRRLREHLPNLWLACDLRRLNDDEAADLIDAADVVLAPYLRFVGSSGVLLWAARAGKPVISQDFGLIGKSVRDYGLGIATDTESSPALAAAIRSMAYRGSATPPNRDALHRFLSGREPARFAATIWRCALAS